jgi:hypothetical protein
MPSPDLERNRACLRASIAYGETWLACHQIRESALLADPISAEASVLVSELDASQSQLSRLLVDGTHAAVCELSLSVLVLCERIDLELNQGTLQI